ncbi:EamA family transporter [Streptosporangium sandarakinum]
MKLAVVGAAVLWGTAGTAGLLAAGVHPVSLAAARLVVGGLVLAAVAGPAVRSLPHRGLLVAAALAVAAYQLCFFGAVSRTGVAVGTVVAIGSGPVFAGLLTWLLDRVRPTRRWVGATAAAVARGPGQTGGGGGGRGGAGVGGLVGGRV